jgi:predicted ATP-binding protein involved in virulence
MAKLMSTNPKNTETKKKYILSAIYLKNSFRGTEPLIMNFGGHYIYSVDGTSCIRHKNNEYVEDFYGPGPLTLITAVVGKNGSGKTSLLRQIAQLIDPRYFAKNVNNYSIIFELGDKILVRGNALNFDESIERTNDILINTVYYSPQVDFKSEIDGIDLSSDKVLELDIDSFAGIDSGLNGRNLMQHLKFNNDLRHLNLITSQFYHTLSDFDLPPIDLVRIEFQKYTLAMYADTTKGIIFSETPPNFQKHFNDIYSKIKVERENIRIAGQNQEDKPESKGYQNALLKSYILEFVLTYIIYRIDNQKMHFDDGFISDIDNSDELNSLEHFYKFVMLHEIRFIGSTMGQPIIPRESLKKLLEYLFRAIDQETEKVIWEAGERALLINSTEITELLQMRNEFMNEFDKRLQYSYELGSESIYPSSYLSPGFFGLNPSNRQLSSGEFSLLNLYSKIYDFFSRNIDQKQTMLKPEMLLLLLDEADLGFHPKWKQQFIHYITNFFQSFFESYKIPFQVIFCSHDPITLSDIANSNIIYLDKMKILEGNHRPKRSFAANITDILADSFFLDNLIGKFAANKVQEIIKWLEGEEFSEESKEKYRKIIALIDEPIVQRKLAEMYDSRINSDLELELINKQLIELQNRRKAITNK